MTYRFPLYNCNLLPSVLKDNVPVAFPYCKTDKSACCSYFLLEFINHLVNLFFVFADFGNTGSGHLFFLIASGVSFKDNLKNQLGYQFIIISEVIYSTMGWVIF